jgi:hypothetical protein
MARRDPAPKDGETTGLGAETTRSSTRMVDLDCNHGLKIL